MREIKFRMWNFVKENPAASKMFYDADEVVECLMQQIKFDNNPRRGYDHVSDGVSFMQLIKNIDGTDIYEGDVVVWKVNDIERTASVYFDEQASCFWMGRDKSTDQLVLNDWMRGEYQVIGNIHENPELL